MNSRSAARLADALRTRAEQHLAAGNIGMDGATRAYRLADEIEQAGSGPRGVIAYESSPRLPLRERAGTLREELTHELQDRIEGSEGPPEFYKQARAHIATRIAEPALRRMRYSLDDRTVVNETAAKIAAGGRQSLGIPVGVGESFLKHYGETLDKHFGEGSGNTVLRHAERSVRMESSNAPDNSETRGPPVRRDAGGPLPRTAAGGPAGEHPPDSEDRGTGGDVEGTPKERGGLRGERGSAPILSDLAGAITKQLGSSDAAKSNYSGLGATKDRFVRNLSQLEEASPKAHEAVVRAAQSRSQSAVLIRAAAPRIEEALGKNGPSFKDFRRTLVESRLQGLEERWSDLARQAGGQSDAGLEKAFDNGLGDLLKNIEGKRGLPQDVGQTAAALLEQKDYPTLRQFLSQTFSDAAGSVAHVMTPEEFDATRMHPNFGGALDLYKNLLEKPMATNHALNEGIFSNALGPLNTYYPLSPASAEDVARVRAGKAYAKPKNPGNSFATGLAQDYDESMSALSDKLARAYHANNKAAAMTALEDSGLITEIKQGQRPGDEIEVDGQRYKAATLESGVDRQVIREGKSTFVPGKRYLAPEWLKNELGPVFDKGDLRRFSERGLIGKLNDVAISGPADAAFHSANLLGTLVSNTPGLGTSLASKAASIPFVKRFTAIGKALTTDPATPESARDLEEMARIGVLPERFASQTYSRKYAELTGAELRRFSFGPALFGPKGIDVRARLSMYRIAKEFNPEAGPAETYKFVNQLGIYTQSLESGVVRSLKNSGIAPFATAGSQMVRNGINAWLGTGPTPTPGSMGQKLASHLTGGAIGTVATWMLVHHAVTGKWPQDDPKSEFLKIPLPESVRRTSLGKALYGTKPGTAYADLSFFSPLVKRGASALGIQQAYDTWRAGGNTRQAVESAATGPINAALHPVMGPIPRAAYVGITGQEPYVTGLTSREGTPGAQFLPATPKGDTFPHLGAAARQLNSFYGNAGAATGMLPAQPWESNEGNKWLRMVVDMGAPGLLGRAVNVPAKNEALRKQRVAERTAAISDRNAARAGAK